MIPGVHNIKVKRGDTFRLFFRARAKNPDDSPGAYFNFTGMFPKAQFRDAAGVLLAELEVSIGDQITYPGSILCRLGPVATQALALTTTAKYDVQVSTVVAAAITNADDNNTYLSGTVEILDDVTKVGP